MIDKKRIGIVIIATNAYFVLGIRFIKKFMQHYKGNSEIKFYCFNSTMVANIQKTKLTINRIKNLTTEINVYLVNFVSDEIPF